MPIARVGVILAGIFGAIHCLAQGSNAEFEALP
jgi:hypothetical protein